MFLLYLFGKYPYSHATTICIHSLFPVGFFIRLRARTNAVEHRFNLSECCHVVAWCRMSILTPATSNQEAVIMVTIFSIRMKLKISGPRSRYRGSFTAKKTFSRSFILPRGIPENGQQSPASRGLFLRPGCNLYTCLFRWLRHLVEWSIAYYGLPLSPRRHGGTIFNLEVTTLVLRFLECYLSQAEVSSTIQPWSQEDRSFCGTLFQTLNGLM